MSRRLLSAVAVLISLAAPSIGMADPITYNFSNTTQNPDTAQFSVQQLGNPAAINPGPLFDYATLNGSNPSSGNSSSIDGFQFNFANWKDALFANAVAGQPINLQNFDFSSDTSAEVDLSTTGWRTALISSIQPDFVPEPGTLVVFAALGMATLVYGRWRHASGVSRIVWSPSRNISEFALVTR